MKRPKWLEKAVFYEIYPQSYFDTNGDGIGDIQGIIEKMDYVKSLGCNAIWLNPWYDSPFNDAGYDIRNYYMVAPRYGTNEDAKRLFEEAEKRDMKIVLDLVVGHTSMDCEWFVESAKTERNQYSDRYIWSPFMAWRGDNDLSRDEDYYISGYSQRGAYKSNFFYNQPALNFGFAKPKFDWELPVNHPACIETKEEVKRIMRFWMDMGCAGFRVDMASSLIKRDPDQKEIVKLWKEMRAMFDKDYPQCVLISEWGDPSVSVKAGFHCDFTILDNYNVLTRNEYAWAMPGMKTFDYTVFDRDGKGDVSFFTAQYDKDYAATKGKGYICFITGNHDVRRLSKYMTPEEMKVYYAFMLTMPGVPFIYYGDEIGMKYLEGLASKEGGDVRTGARTPMQWNDWENRGFSKGRKEDLYLPVDERDDAPTVNAQYEDPDSILSKVRELVALRQAHRGLCADGEYIPLYMKKKSYPFVYERVLGKEKYIICINPTKFEQSVKVKVKGAKSLECLSEMRCSAAAEKGYVTFDAQGTAYGIYKIKE